MAVRNVEGFHDASLMLLHHHERLDGNGYPGRLKGSEIPRGSRLIAVADSLDALTTDRPYRTARSVDEAVFEIRSSAGTQFDPDVVSAFCSSLVRLAATA